MEMEDNIKMDLKDIFWGVDRTNVAQHMDKWQDLLNAVMNPWFL
jgi:hypothetical protein